PVSVCVSPEKAYDITYVNLRFYSPRPESFAIYKRSTEDAPWVPYQFYRVSSTLSEPLVSGTYTHMTLLCCKCRKTLSKATKPNWFSLPHSPPGSQSLQCDDSGQCPCKPGVGGQRCDRCLPDFYDFGEYGCRPCTCMAAGSLNNEPRCDSQTGLCQCKENVDGRQCDKCKPGFFGLSPEDPFGCISCFCYGHSSECTSATGFYPANITTDFDTGRQRWSGMTRSNKEVETQYNGVVENLGLSSETGEPTYFVSAPQYHGDQRLSYNQFLTFDLRIGEETARPSVVDIILEGSGKSISTHIFAQGNPVPDVTVQTFAFRLHENPEYQWSPRLNPVDFIGLLANVTAVKIRATYNDQGVGFIDNIHLGTARQGFNQGSEATWVESCVCREGHIGQFCEACSQGYKRDTPNGGPFARCVPCQCNGHSDSCDVSSGNLCDICLDGYYGDPTGLLTGVPSRCQKCTCNGNIDPNAVGNCNTTTGECLKCIRNTGGFFCDQCLPDFYNNTLGQCTACNCYPPGTVSQPGTRGCDVRSGQCLCLDNVVGRQCERCELGYWDIVSGQACECDRVGSSNYTCDERSGQCQCKDGVAGRMCERCADYFFGHSESGCMACNCDPSGSLDLQCDVQTGYCECKENVDGPRCDRCMENKYDIAAGCLDCPQCYNLVQRQVNTHRGKLRELTVVIEQTVDNPSLFNDTEFVSHLNKVSMAIDGLLREARGASTGDGTIGQQLEALRNSLADVLTKCGQISRNIASAGQATAESQSDIDAAEEAIERADAALAVARSYIDDEGRAALKQALAALANFGQNSEQMTEIARQAAMEADRQKEEAQMIEDLANKALETSREAYRLANESLNMPLRTQQEIERLRREYDDASLLFQSTKTVANNTLNRAVSARDEAYSLLTL
ncbi:laminin subunit gamma-1, partial [Aplysia californica]|uniref:Laminin subunit gamma-1 n=1 Tax=Aplysia californica TaxID=6500 RepID=A0ABM1A688_APLCA